MTKVAKQKLGPNQRKWLKALESGEYKQTRAGLLHSKNNSFCCLGVACTLFKPKSLKPVLRKNDILIDSWHYGDDALVAPEFVIEALNLRGNEGPAEDDTNSLAALNDDGKRFKTIAALIRDNPANYFRAPA